MRIISQQKAGRTRVASGLSSRMLRLARVLGKTLFFATLLHSPIQAFSATWYVDSSVVTSDNGTSWANAWQNISNITGVKAGDTVYISGGPSGSSRNYVMTSIWFPAGGAAGNPITYQIGQDSLHNGTAVFSPGTNFNSSSGVVEWIQASALWGNANVVISGDAGDGNMHFSASGFAEPVGLYGPLQNFRLSYINFGNTPIGPTSDNGASVLGPGIEIDHTYAYINNTGADHYSAMWFGGTAYDQNVFHDNVLYVPRLAGNTVNSAGGDGADGLQWNGSGMSIYDNTLIAYTSAYTANQHQDGWQSEGGQYVKIYGNVIANMANYGLYPEGLYGGFQHMMIYNNIILQVASQAIAVGTGGPNSLSPNGAWDNDVIVANNFSDGGSWSVALWNAVDLGPTAGIAGVGLVVANNTGVGGTFQLDANVASLNNVTITPAQAAHYFTSYSSGADVDANGNMVDNLHLTSAATSLIGKGANLSAYFSTDKDGKTRPASGGWDVGPYQYGTGVQSSNNPVLQVTPGSVAFGTVLSGTSVTNSITVQNVGSGTLTGTASVGAAPFGIVSGGSYSLGANQSQTVTVVFSPMVASNYTQSVSFSGGGGTNATLSGSATTTLPAVQLQVTPTRQFVLTVTGTIGHTYNIQATQDFKTWRIIGTMSVGASGSSNFTDTNAASFSKRFYRIQG